MLNLEIWKEIHLFASILHVASFALSLVAVYLIMDLSAQIWTINLTREKLANFENLLRREMTLFLGYSSVFLRCVFS